MIESLKYTCGLTILKYEIPISPYLNRQIKNEIYLLIRCREYYVESHYPATDGALFMIVNNKEDLYSILADERSNDDIKKLIIEGKLDGFDSYNRHGWGNEKIYYKFIGISDMKQNKYFDITIDGACG
jgi:hypothetical protein